MIPDCKFEILYRDIVVTSIEIKEGNVVRCEKHVNRIVIQPFFVGDVDENRIVDFFKDRCFSPERPDKKAILSHLGLEEYDPYEIVKKTHGILLGDFTWIRFEGEDIEWRDIEHVYR